MKHQSTFMSSAARFPKVLALLQDFLSSPACLSDKSRIKMNKSMELWRNYTDRNRRLVEEPALEPFCATHY